MHPLIARKHQEIVAVCRYYGVRRLDVFGSAARGTDFDTGPCDSDVDFLVEFSTDSPAATSMREHLALRAALAAILGRTVELLPAENINNPYVRAEIEQTRETVTIMPTCDERVGEPLDALTAQAQELDMGY